jgi:hypothetical protein
MSNMYYILIAIEKCTKPRFTHFYYLFTNNIEIINLLRNKMTQYSNYFKSIENKNENDDKNLHFHERLYKITSIDIENKTFSSNLIFINHIISIELINFI